MTRDILELIASTDRRSPPVVRCEDDQVWVSGMNQRVWVRAREIADRLTEADFVVGEPRQDESARNPGVVIPVLGCRTLAGEVYEEVTGR